MIYLEPCSYRNKEGIFWKHGGDSKEEYEKWIKTYVKGFDYYWEIIETPYPEHMAKTAWW
jgi:hypothetical protein